jgi:Na+-driven multidrug efflux pump
MVPNRHWIRRLLRISVPAGVDSLSVVLGQFWFLSIVNRLGDVAAGAHGIAIRWEALGYLSGAAFGTAAMTLVGQNLGAGNPRRAARSGWTAWLMGAGVMTTMGAVFYTLAPFMFQLFCPGPDQESIVLAGVPVLRLVAFAMPPLACCIVFTYALRGAGDTRVPMLITWLGFLGLRIPLAYILTDGIHLSFIHIAGFELGLIGAWIAMVADIVARGACFVLRFTTGAWQRVEV